MKDILFKVLMLKGDAGEPTDEQTLAAVGEYMQAHPEAAIDETIINSAVDDWLDDHPEATTTVQDGSLTEAKFTNALKMKTIKDYVTPEMFGAVGDGLTDDSDAVQSAIDNGLIVYCEGTYLVKDIKINKTTHIHGGSFINNGSSNYMIEVDDENGDIDDVVLENMIIDGQSSSNGIMLNYCMNAIIKNVEVKNIKASSDTIGIYINRSSDVLIDRCLIHDVSNDNSQPTRGILSNRSIRTLISNTIVHNITSGNDGDGIQIIFDGSADETEDGCIITNCKVYDCSKRYIKIQQRNCIIENCKLLEADSTIQASDASIAVYDCNCIVRNNYINGNCVIQIMLGGTALEADVFENTLIQGNVIKSISTDSTFPLVSSVTSPNTPFRNLSIVENNFIGLSKFSGVVFRNWSGENVNISNNNFYNLNSGVWFRWDSGHDNQTIDNIVISHNTFKDIQIVPIYVQYTQYHINYLTIIGNSFNIITGLGGIMNVIVIASASYDTDKITIQNNIGNGYDGWLRIGYWSTRPSGVPDGFVYFCRNLMMPLTYYAGNWYKPDGTVYSG